VTAACLRFPGHVETIARSASGISAATLTGPNTKHYGDFGVQEEPADWLGISPAHRNRGHTIRCEHRGRSLAGARLAVMPRLRSILIFKLGAMAGMVSAAAFVKGATLSRGNEESDELSLVAVLDGIPLKSRVTAFKGGFDARVVRRHFARSPRRRTGV
jgi:hypothetical protein